MTESLLVVVAAGAVWLPLTAEMTWEAPPKAVVTKSVQLLLVSSIESGDLIGGPNSNFSALV